MRHQHWSNHLLRSMLQEYGRQNARFCLSETATEECDKLRATRLQTYPVEVGVSAIALAIISLRHVIVDDDVHTLDVNTSANQIRGHQQALLTLLELLVGIEPAMYSHTTLMPGTSCR